MALKLYDKIVPSDEFALVDAEHVEMPNGTRLDVFLCGGSSEEVVLAETTYTSALDETYGYCYSPDGEFVFAVGETYKVVWHGEEFTCQAMDGSSLMDGAVFIGNGVSFGLPGNNEPFVIGTIGGGLLIVSLADSEPTEHTVAIYRVTATSGVVSSPATSVDLTSFESSGTIVETYADGSTKTYTMEFDGNGNPTKVTDSNGNVTVLIW